MVLIKHYLTVDIDIFLANYPRTPDNLKATAKIDFYSNRIAMMPDRMRYEDFMRKYERDLRSWRLISWSPPLG